MKIISPYTKLYELKNTLKSTYNFSLNEQWSGHHLDLPSEMGTGSIDMYTSGNLQFMRGNWKTHKPTLFHSKDPVGKDDIIDFRIDKTKQINSSFLEDYKEYKWDISNINGFRMFFPKKCFTRNKVELINKFENYCLDVNISNIIDDLFNISSQNFEDCIKMQWKFLELSYYYIEFLNKKDIARHFYELSNEHLNALGNAKNYIDSNFFELISIKNLSRRVGINELYLKNGFRKLYGYSVKQYIIKLRMEKAKKLVLADNTPINEISSQLSYSNLSHFIKLYKRFHQTTPLQHRITNIR